MSIFAAVPPVQSLEHIDIVLDRTLYPQHHPATAADVLGLIQELKSKTGVGVTKILANGTKVEKTLHLDDSGLFLVYSPTLKTVIQATIFIPSIAEVRPGCVSLAFNRCVVLPERQPYCINIMTNDGNPTLSFMFQEGSMHVWLTVLSMLMRRANALIAKNPLKVRMIHLWQNCVLRYTKEVQEAQERGIFYTMVATIKLLMQQVRETASTTIRAGKEPIASPVSPVAAASTPTSPKATPIPATTVRFYQLHGFFTSLGASREIVYYINKFLPNDTVERTFFETAHFLQHVLFGTLFELESLFSAVIELEDYKAQKRKVEEKAHPISSSHGNSSNYEGIDVVRSTAVSPAMRPPANVADFLPPGSFPPMIASRITVPALIGFYEQFQHQKLSPGEVVALFLSQQLFTDSSSDDQSSSASSSASSPSTPADAGGASSHGSAAGAAVEQSDPSDAPFHYLHPSRQKSLAQKKRLQEKSDEDIDHQHLSFTFAEFCGVLYDVEQNSWFKPRHKTVYQDMTHPLCHYFINSSHNTYLTGDQFASNSSTEMYRISLLRGYRCLEIDCWDGDDGNPIVYHGHTRTSRISFESVVTTINEFAFTTSPYPVILSLEVHTNLHQQHLMAVNMFVIFGPKLLYMSDEDYDNIYPPNGPQGSFNYTPEALKFKIIVKSKRKIDHFLSHERRSGGAGDSDEDEEYVTLTVAGNSSNVVSTTVDVGGGATANAADFKEETDSETDGEGDQLRITASDGATSNTLKKLRLSDVVGMPACRCESVADRIRTCFPFEVSSFGESRAMHVLANERAAWIKLNKLMSSRIYPKGSRINSSNYHPQVMWNVGCQLVALNVQTYDAPLRYNEGKFEQNGRCGYILKPPFLRGNVPKQPSVHGARVSAYRGCRCYILRIKVIGGMMIPRPSFTSSGGIVSPFVRLRLDGVPEDESRSDVASSVQLGTNRSRASHSFTNVVHKTSPVTANGINPVWLEEFSFNIQCIELACLTVSVCHQGEGEVDEIADATIPVCSLRLGYRAVPLRNIKTNFVLRHSSLLCHFALQEV